MLGQGSKPSVPRAPERGTCSQYTPSQVPNSLLHPVLDPIAKRQPLKILVGAFAIKFLTETTIGIMIS